MRAINAMEVNAIYGGASGIAPPITGSHLPEIEFPQCPTPISGDDAEGM